jgi:hypothetical protein
MLITAAVLDLTRCGLVMAAARHPVPTAALVAAGLAAAGLAAAGLAAAGLAAAGLAAAGLAARTARGCRAGRRWAGWAALLPIMSLRHTCLTQLGGGCFSLLVVAVWPGALSHGAAGLRVA